MGNSENDNVKVVAQRICNIAKGDLRELIYADLIDIRDECVQYIDMINESGEEEITDQRLLSILIHLKINIVEHLGGHIQSLGGYIDELISSPHLDHLE